MRRMVLDRGLKGVAMVSARCFLTMSVCLCLTLAAAAQDLRLQPADANHVAIPRAAFGKDFLLSASVIPQSGAPTSNGLAGRIVRFELFPDGVDMYESTEGQIVTQDLPAKRLLTTFPIVGQNEASVNIDFNKGMNRVFTGDWYGSGSFYPEENANVLEVVQSRVFEVKQAQNRLLIRQSAQVRNRQYSENEEARFELRYFISPYAPSDLPGKENLERDQRYVRFFEVSPKLEVTTGRSTSHIARFDIRQPVVFHYSANTPADYEQAVKDGILYWNRAFGKEVVKAEKAPDGVTAPSPELNIVQWVPYDNAGFAYADALLDPRNGQTLHGQAYVTSVFAISGKQRARAVLRQLQTTAKAAMKAEKLAAETEKKQPGDRPTKPNRSPNRFGIRFLKPACSCDMNSHEFTKQMITGLQDMLAQGPVSDAKVLLASQDYVRNVTAHEVGHARVGTRGEGEIRRGEDVG